MYATCAFCYGSLGSNAVLETFSVSRRVAFDPAKGCVWAVCARCSRWNLAPLELRWEVVDECERRFRGTALRYSSGNVGLAWIAEDLELVRIGRALRPEVAAWRYGRILKRPRSAVKRAVEGLNAVVLEAWRVLARQRRKSHRADPRAALAHLMFRVSGNRVLDVVHLKPELDPDTENLPVAVVRYSHLLDAALVRPESGRPWALRIPHDHGVLSMEGDDGLRAAARAFAIINGTERGGGFSVELLETAARKVDESAQAGAYFNRVLAIALRSSWGRYAPEGGYTLPARVETHEQAESDVERLAFRLTGRTFWGRGGIGSEPSTALLDIPLEDRVALEMAANEESERRALEGELEELTEAWREAAEIAAIADALLD